VRPWEPIAVFLVTFLVLALFTPRVTTYLDPTTGDEPFYLMTAISILKDGDLNECNNYIQHDELSIYPSGYGFGSNGQAFVNFPPNWVGWRGSPLPLPPPPSRIYTAPRQCSSNYGARPFTNPTGELYSKHGLGLSLMVLPAFALGGRFLVVFFLNLVGALLAATIYLFARESVARLAPAILTWVAFAFTVPLMPYSYLIFTEMPAALLTLYAFRRIRAWNNNAFQAAGIGFCVAFLPWLHYRFAPICVGLGIYYLYQARKHRDQPPSRRIRDWTLVGSQVLASAVLLMIFFYTRYGLPIPNGSDHAGISDVAGTLRGAVGLFLDEQWGVFVASPIFILILVGLILMCIFRAWRGDLLWIAVVALPYFAVIANYAQWWGEWCPPGRYMASILPLLALPFCLALDKIKGITYRVLYGILLALSFLTMAGFLFQPQWMYNQPILSGRLNGRSELLAHGFQSLGNALHLPAITNIDLTSFFPSFVSPYFAYNQSKTLGAIAAGDAWRASIWPALIILLILALSLYLFWRSPRPTPPEPPSSSPLETLPPVNIALPTRPLRTAPPPVPSAPALDGLPVRKRESPGFAPFSTFMAAVGLLFPFPVPNPFVRARFCSALASPGFGQLPLLPTSFGTVRFAANSPPALSAPDNPPADLHEDSPAGDAPPGKRTIWDRIDANLIWRTRALWLGLGGVGLAMYAQKLTTVDRDILSSIHWYALAIFVILLGWLDTYTDRSFLTRPVTRLKRLLTPPPSDPTTAPSPNGLHPTSPDDPLPVPTEPLATSSSPPAPRKLLPPLQRVSRFLPSSMAGWWRYSLAFAALLINLFAAQLLRANYYSALGSWAWLLSLALLLLAFVREPKRHVRDLDPSTDIMEQTDVRLSRRVEVAIVIAIFLLALGLRLLNLGEWTTGMHGDEGEAGMDAIGILEGNQASPFETGWFAQPNFYYWGIALSMKLFGTTLFGLRMFSALVGALMILPFYPLVKMWFGIRTAIIATLVLAFSDIAIHFSRAEFSNITTPAFLVAGFYFLFRGLHNHRTLDFILSGYGFMLSLYFYLGGRITPFLLLGVFAFIFLLSPLLRLPSTYRLLRASSPTLSRLSSLRSAIAQQARTVTPYFSRLLIFCIACVCFISPWFVYYIDHTQMLGERTNDKLIFSNADRMASQYHETHDPLYIGLRMPVAGDVFPFLPIVFEPTPLNVQVAHDGFWPRVLWDQLTTTLSIFTYRRDASSVYTFANGPVAKPIESALLILGIAWALWRWRDTRMAILSGWFWSSVIIGGALTIDAPYIARIVAVIPVMAIFIALPLSKLVAEFIRFGRLLSARFRSFRLRRVTLGASRVFSTSVVGALLLYLALQNYSDYFMNYTRSYQFTEVTGQSVFVRDTNSRLAAEGRPVPDYYDVGSYLIFWDHGDNRFLNHGVAGQDMVNPSDDLPIVGNGDRDAIFMVWDNNHQYLSVLKSYYPDGIEDDYHYGPNHLFTSFRVKKESIDARRISIATYTPAAGDPIQREEHGLGTTSAPPAGLTYPVQASWSSGLFAPQFGRYRFSLDLPDNAQFLIDGTPVLTTTIDDTHAETSLLLARGIHDVELRGVLNGEASQARLEWQAGGQASSPVPNEFLWYGPGRGLFGQVWQYATGLTGSAWDDAQPKLPPTILTRIDGFLGFRNTPGSLSPGPFTADWKGDVTAPQSGTYTFETFSYGASAVLVDGKVVVNNTTSGVDPRSITGDIDLTAGNHAIEVRYQWLDHTGYLELFWTTPDGTRSLLGPDSLHTTGGIVSSDAAGEPPPVQLSSTPPAFLAPDKVLGDSGTLKGPRGLAVGPDGNLYIGDRENNRIVVMSPDGSILRTWGKRAAQGQPPEPDEFSDIVDLAVGPDGNIFVMDLGANRLQVFDPQGTLLKSIPGSSLGTSSANGIAVGPDGTLYVAETGADAIEVVPSPLSDSANLTAATITGGTSLQRLTQPVDVIADPTGSGLIYVADLKNRIAQVYPDGSIGKTWPIMVGTSIGGSRLAISANGSVLYMSDPDRQRVAVIYLDTGEIDYFGTDGDTPGKFRSPQSLALDPDGRLYVLDRTRGNVQLFTIK
jgi:sugar lactone lactonase YvrE/4-amino-4-deoxy-L-arabinose transferase-like glycosyltransferase